MRTRFLAILITVLLFSYTSYSQLGAFGELSFKGTVYPDTVDGLLLFGSSLYLEPFKTSNGTSESIGPNDPFYRYVPEHEVFDARITINYSRFFAIGLSSYVSLGLGYSYFPSTFTFSNDSESENKIVHQHYVSIPLRFHLLSNKVRKQNPYQDKISTGANLQNLHGGIELSIGASTYIPVAPKKIIKSDNIDQAEEYDIVMSSFSEGYSAFVFEPEITFAVATGIGVVFNFTAGYPLQPLFKNQRHDLLTTENGTLAVQAQTNMSYNLSFSIAFRGGTFKGN